MGCDDPILLSRAYNKESEAMDRRASIISNPFNHLLSVNMTEQELRSSIRKAIQRRQTERSTHNFRNLHREKFERPLLLVVFESESTPKFETVAPSISALRAGSKVMPPRE